MIRHSNASLLMNPPALRAFASHEISGYWYTTTCYYFRGNREGGRVAPRAPFTHCQPGRGARGATRPPAQADFGVQSAKVFAEFSPVPTAIGLARFVMQSMSNPKRRPPLYPVAALQNLAEVRGVLALAPAFSSSAVTSPRSHRFGLWNARNRDYKSRHAAWREPSA